MRILMLTQWFDPEPAFKGLPFAEELVRLGHEVQVITGFPNFPSGHVYNGYKVSLFKREVMEGIEILRVPLYPSHNNSAFRRTVNYLSFALAASTIGVLLSKPADVMYVYHPPGTIGLPALSAKLFRKIPFVYDIQDLWPDAIAASGMLKSKSALWLVNLWCRLLYDRASKIVVLSPGLKEILVARGVPKDKIDVIYNWCDDGHIRPMNRAKELASALGLANRFNILHAGNIGKAQNLSAVIDAARFVEKRFPEIQFVFAGIGLELDELKHKATALGLRNVRFLGQYPASQIGPVLSLADVLLVHLKDDPSYCATIPSKTQAYMAAGRPILMAARGDAADLVLKAKAGLICEPSNPDSIAKAVEELYVSPQERLEAMGRMGRQYFEHELCRAIGVRKFERLFEEVLFRHRTTDARRVRS